VSKTLIEAKVWTMARTNKGSAVLIRPVGVERFVPIFIGQLEAQAIFKSMSKVKLPRPLTHDLFMNMLQRCSMNIDRVEIHDINDATYYSHIVARQGRKKYAFDSRPSDAIAIAIRLGCPIYIAEYIINAAGVPISVITDAERISVNKTTLEEFKQALQKAIREENYEDAAKIRDRIQEIESKQSDLDADVMNLEDGLLKLFEDTNLDELQKDD